MEATVIVTATTGPGVEVTSLRVERVREVNFNLFEGVLSLVKEGEVTKEFDLGEVSAITVGISGSVYTFTVS